jgi:hypothetical protein
MRQPLLLATLVCLAGCITAQSQNASHPPGKIGFAAVWQPSSQFLTSARATCDQSSRSGLVDCVAQQMAKAGAPPDAVSFTRELDKQTHGDVGFMSDFQKVGPIDIVWIQYAWRPNNNYGLLLVNGQPPMVNVEDLKQLDRKTMEQSFQFRDIKDQFPKVDLWPGDRDGKTWPNSQTGPDGGLQFVMSYPLRNGCPTCAHAGFAIFTWNFNPQGKFVGTSFMGFTPPPLQ